MITKYVLIPDLIDIIIEFDKYFIIEFDVSDSLFPNYSYDIQIKDVNHLIKGVIKTEFDVYKSDKNGKFNFTINNKLICKHPKLQLYVQKNKFPYWNSKSCIYYKYDPAKAFDDFIKDKKYNKPNRMLWLKEDMLLYKLNVTNIVYKIIRKNDVTDYFSKNKKVMKFIDINTNQVVKNVNINFDYDSDYYDNKYHHWIDTYGRYEYKGNLIVQFS